MKCPTEAAITDRREKELADRGWCRWCTARGPTTRLSSACKRLNKPSCTTPTRPTANARLSAQLQLILAISAFRPLSESHDARQESAVSCPASDCETFLNRWIMGYVIDSSAPAEAKASHPLSEARVDVVEIAGKPGAYLVAFMKPHFQVE